MIRRDEQPRWSDSSSVYLPFTVFLAVYVGTMVLGASLSVLLERVLGLDLGRSLLGYATVVFALAALRRPEILFQVLRSTGWFVLIPSDKFMRVLLGIVALFAASGAMGFWQL